MTERQQKFDAIIIGSGMGGLTVAALLSKLHHQKVLVLEQHFTPGGFTHGFERKGKFHWDVGLHYVGQMGKGSPFRTIFDYITDGKLQWQKMTDPFEKFVYPDFTFAVDSHPEKYQADLICQFPDRAASIRQYFKDIKIAEFWLIINALVELAPRFLQPIIDRNFHHFDRISRQTTQEYLDKNFENVQLKALLASQWGDYGLTPAQSCFGIHSTIVTHFLQGGWYPIGGGQAIAKTMIPVIEQAGGTIMTQRRATEIVIESGVATGVKVQHAARPNAEPEFYDAPLVISAVGVFNTYLKLIPPSYPLADRQSIAEFPKGNSFLTVYLGLKESPRKLGFQGENHWIYTSYDHETIVENPSYLPTYCYLSFPSLKDPLATGHTAEIIAYFDYDRFAKWQGQQWRRRDREYTELKSQIQDSMIQLVESRYPGFQELIEYVEVSTPLTVEHFDASDRGAVYGIPAIAARLDRSWMATRTPIQNLYLTGSDTFSLGIIGAMMGGVKTVILVTGIFGFLKIIPNVKYLWVVPIVGIGLTITTLFKVTLVW
jgi:all-trans-retinol 13,14-reductase